MEAIRLSRSRDAAVEASLARSSQAEPDSPEACPGLLSHACICPSFLASNSPSKLLGVCLSQCRGCNFYESRFWFVSLPTPCR